MLKIQDAWLLAQVLHDGPHDTETLPIGVANEFPGRVPAKKVFGLHLSKTIYVHANNQYMTHE